MVVKYIIQYKLKRFQHCELSNMRMQDVIVRISTKPATFARFIHAFNIDDGGSIAAEALLAQVDFARITGFLSVNSCYALRDVFLKAL